MRKNASLFALGCIVFAFLASVLRGIELRSSLDTETMLMTGGAPSAVLIAVCVLAAAALFFAARFFLPSEEPADYAARFRSIPTVAVAAAALVLLAVGSWQQLVHREAHSFIPVISAVLAVLAGCGFFSLSLDAQNRRPGGCTLSAAAMPELFLAALLIQYYKTHAPIPSLLYTGYVFIALCAAMLALHGIAGYTAGKTRPRTTLFLCGLAAILLPVAAVTEKDLAYRCYFAALTIELFLHGILLAAERPSEPDNREAKPAPEDTQEETLP